MVEPSGLVINIVPYHNTECENYKVPTNNCKKSQMAV